MDKLKISLISGLFASITKDLLSSIGDLFFRFHPSYWDYSHYLIFQKTITKLNIELLPSIIVEVFFGVNMAILYIYFIKSIIKTKLNYLLGCIFGLGIWFMIRSFITVFKIEELNPANIPSIFYNWFIATVYGIVLEWMVDRLSKDKN